MIWLFLVSTVYWGALAAMALRAALALERIATLPPPPLARWPKLSLIIPARDEAAEVERALAVRLAEGYPDLEVVLVDDRSTDGTGDVARALAAKDPRVTVTRVDELPEGWLGKVHALAEGLRAARGEWILFSDADVHLAPGTLQRVVAWAEAEQLDHVTALPGIVPGDRPVALALEVFFRVVVTFPRLWAVEDPRSSAAVGVGAFNLVRRRALARTPGLEWLKMEIGDDMALGVMLKRSGARQRVLVAREAVSLRFYATFGAMARALEKNGASLPLPAAIVVLALLVALELGWLAGLAVSPVAAAFVYLFAAGTGLGVATWLGHPRWPALLPGLGALPLGAVLVRSSLLAALRGGVVWRGTFYSTAAVRAGMRIGKKVPAREERAEGGERG